MTSATVSVTTAVVNGSFSVDEFSGSVGASSVDGTPVARVGSPESVDVDESGVVCVVVMSLPGLGSSFVLDCVEPLSLVDDVPM